MSPRCPWGGRAPRLQRGCAEAAPGKARSRPSRRERACHPCMRHPPRAAGPCPSPPSPRRSPGGARGSRCCPGFWAGHGGAGLRARRGHGGRDYSPQRATRRPRQPVMDYTPRRALRRHPAPSRAVPPRCTLGLVVHATHRRPPPGLRWRSRPPVKGCAANGGPRVRSHSARAEPRSQGLLPPHRPGPAAPVAGLVTPGVGRGAPPGNAHLLGRGEPRSAARPQHGSERRPARPAGRRRARVLPAPPPRPLPRPLRLRGRSRPRRGAAARDGSRVANGRAGRGRRAGAACAERGPRAPGAFAARAGGTG